jgi:hypothetical protein
VNILDISQDLRVLDTFPDTLFQLPSLVAVQYARNQNALALVLVDELQSVLCPYVDPLSAFFGFHPFASLSTSMHNSSAGGVFGSNEPPDQSYPSGLTGVDLFGRPVPGHEFVEADHFLVCDAGKNPANPSFGVNLVHATGFNEGGLVLVPFRSLNSFMRPFVRMPRCVFWGDTATFYR